MIAPIDPARPEIGKAMEILTPQQEKRRYKKLLKKAKRLRSKMRGKRRDHDRELANMLARVIPVLTVAAQTGTIRNSDESELAFKFRCTLRYLDSVEGEAA